MQKKIVLIVNILVLIGILSVISLLLFRNYVGVEETVDEECVDVHKTSSFIYDICYDSYSKTIFIGAERGSDSYKIESISFSFYDVDYQLYEVEEVPANGKSKAYKISAEKNPGNLSVRLNIEKDFSAPICSGPRVLEVSYCPARTSQENMAAEISPFENFDASSFITVESADSTASDIFSTSLFDKEVAWESKCSSDWDCEDWGECIDGLQRRDCVDSEDCYIPVNKPETVRYCDDTCVENWQCTWSDCSKGYTTPNCKDLNDCGTENNKPGKLQCDNPTTCTPDITCTEWTSCEIDYDFLDLIGENIERLSGTRSRVCSDNNKCSNPKQETEDCSLNIDIYTKEFTKCGKDYIGIYDQLTDELIARIDLGTDSNPALNLYLDDQADSQYCDYCYNGVMDGDETGIDCGGGCMTCDEKYGPVAYTASSWFSRLF